MKITCLIEDTCEKEGCVPEHGLSLYIETESGADSCRPCSERLLFDTGADDRFLSNADALGVDLTRVDTAVISHGHYDHGGGLNAFLRVNPSAPVYIRRNAFDAYYHNTPVREKYIGLPTDLLPGPRFRLVDGDCTIGEGRYLLTGVPGRRLFPSGNLSLKRKEGKTFLQDDFSHEQSLVLYENGRYALVCGCSHCGILNILDCFSRRFDRLPDLVVGGFHLAKKGDYTREEISLMTETARLLAAMPTRFYTCHCTGERAYEIMKPVLKDRLHYLRTGDTLREPPV